MKTQCFHARRLLARCFTVVLAAFNLFPRCAAAEDMLNEQLYSQVLIDRFEYRPHAHGHTLDWDGQAWIGGDYQRLWLKTEGRRLGGGSVDEAELQVLYGRLIAPFWDIQAGLRYDERPRPSRTYAVFGVQGLAPYWFEVEAAAFLSERGDLSARLEAEHDLLITQRWIVQPRIETNVAAQAVEELGVGRGINDVNAELRLRYEWRREFAPYVGIVWTKSMGAAAKFARARGDGAENGAVVAGIRAWF